MEAAKYYGKFIEKQRNEKKVTKSALGYGIYATSGMGKIERGERYPDKITRDRLLSRLGESCYDYECFLQPEEYKAWEERRDILDSLDNLELEKAELLLAEYKKKMAKAGKVAKQFFYVMQAQLMELKAASMDERCQVLEEAVQLTIPDADNVPLLQRVLSVQELNLLLEYRATKHPNELQQFCLEMRQYMQDNYFDLESRAMLGAKLALYYCNAIPGKVESEVEPMEEFQTLRRTLEICTEGIEALRNHQKIYFAWELLDKKVQYLKKLKKYNVMFSKETVAENQRDLEQTIEFYQLIDGLYEKYQIPKSTNSMTCFYREHEIYCINDVARARRRMYGISREEIEKTLFGMSTIKRLENNSNGMQLENVLSLFERLYLSREMHRAQIITDNQQAIEIEKKIRWEVNQRYYTKAEELLNELQNLISMTNRFNQQYIFYSKINISYAKGEITKEEFLKHAKEALELTAPLVVAMAEIKEEKVRNGKIWKGEKYLTNIEVTILYNMALAHGIQGENRYWKMLKEYFDWLEKKCTLTPILGMYGFVMTAVASWMGNLEYYEESSCINAKILRELLRTRSFSYVHSNMYGILWNNRNQKGLPVGKEDPEWRQGLLDCLTVDTYCKDDWLASCIKARLTE